MVDLLLYVNLNCDNVVDIINRIKNRNDLDNVIKQELVFTIEESTPHCTWDAND